MLVLVRKVQQGIWIDGDIYVRVLNVERDRVKLGISAPDSVKVMRQEISGLDEPTTQKREQETQPEVQEDTS